VWKVAEHRFLGNMLQFTCSVSCLGRGGSHLLLNHPPLLPSTKPLFLGFAQCASGPEGIGEGDIGRHQRMAVAVLTTDTIT
jgi:hypothetical protein